MANEYVIHGAKLECGLGIAPSKLNIKPRHRVKLRDNYMANICDVDVGTFVSCNKSYPPVPCSPVCVMWIGGKPDVLIEGKPALLSADRLICVAGGGMITVSDSGQ